MTQEHFHVGETLNTREVNKEIVDRLFQETVSSGKTVYWAGIEENVNRHSGSEKVIIAAKAIKSFDTKTMVEKPIGLLLISYDSNAFRERFSGISRTDQYYMLLDHKGRIIFSPVKEQIGKQADRAFLDRFRAASGHFTDRINSEKTTVTYQKTSRNDWLLIGLVPLRSLDAMINDISKNTLIIILLCVSLCFSGLLFDRPQICGTHQKNNK